MRAALLWALCFSAPCHAQSALGGGTGLIAIPTAQVHAEGGAEFQYSLMYPDLTRTERSDVYYASLGFAPGLELGARAVATALRAGRRDLSLDAKYQLPWQLQTRHSGEETTSVSFALGATDLGGVERLLPREYAVGTWTSEHLDLTLGYGRGRSVLDGAFGGFEWRPWRYVAVMAEHDAEDVNAGLRLRSAEWRGWSVGGTAAWRGAVEGPEYALSVLVMLGGAKDAAELSAGGPLGPTVAPLAGHRGQGPSHSQGSSYRNVAAALEDLGFEFIRTATTPDNATLVVQLDNRRYNHSQADGIGLALGTIRAHATPGITRIELYLHVYGVPQLHVVSDGDTLHIEPVSEVANDDTLAWDQDPSSLDALELVIEPVLRTAVATEYGMLDYAAALRARLTAPLGKGLLAHLAATSPAALSDDFGGGDAFGTIAPKGGIDIALGQYLHSPAPGWTLLWSAGQARVFRIGARTAALDTAWSPGRGAHRVRAKLMAMDTDFGLREVALAGYTWLDARRDYSWSITGGRFFAGDSGVRVDLERYFGDVIAGLFWKFASPDDQAVGVAMSLPLTLGRDMRPRGLQIKGARRWQHSLGTTLNGPGNATNPEGSNPIRPLLLHEPVLDLDLERDIHDGGRLNAEYLLDETGRMQEAYQRWGG
ncbi:MAG TPA: YjbH domain-containing protein [Verrucomicrobiae bacterium]|nr:YjbH domain-containing protein [Verrucomicrobiae bacterium]